MRRSRGRGVEVDTLADFDHRLAAGATSLRGWRIRAVDLSHRSAELGDLRVAGALFLGCRFAADEADRVEARGNVVERLDVLRPAGLVDERQLEARRARVDDKDAAQNGQTQSRTSG